jgi:hypothetical protein
MGGPEGKGEWHQPKSNARLVCMARPIIDRVGRTPLIGIEYPLVSISARFFSFMIRPMLTATAPAFNAMRACVRLYLHLTVLPG